MEDKVNAHVSGSVVDNISRAVWIRRTCTMHEDEGRKDVIDVL
jgi:hypothetical protein